MSDHKDQKDSLESNKHLNKFFARSLGVSINVNQYTKKKHRINYLNNLLSSSTKKKPEIRLLRPAYSISIMLDCRWSIITSIKSAKTSLLLLKPLDLIKFGLWLVP